MNLVGPGDSVHMFEPYYSQYVNHIEFAGAKIKTSPMYTEDDGSWHFDIDHFEKSIDSSTKLLMITNPHNPSGKLWTRQEIEKLSEILDRHPQIRVISDDVYFFLPFDGRKYESFANFSPSNFAKTITVFSSGKMLNCTGWKVGWMVGPKDLVAQAMYVHEATTFNCNVPGQIAVAQSLDRAFSDEVHDGHSGYFEYTRKNFEKARNLALDVLAKTTSFEFKPTLCESGYFMPVDVTNSRDLIPEKYFQANVNYEDDTNTLVK